MPRRVIEAGSFTFDELRLPNQSTDEHALARQVLEVSGAGIESLAFDLFAFPTFDLIECVIVQSVAQKLIPAEMFDYTAWRKRGAPKAAMRELFSRIDQARRSEPEFETHKARVEELEALYAAGLAVDPMIARTLEVSVPLSSGDEAVFLLDGRHRLFAAAALRVDELPVYVGVPVS